MVKKIFLALTLIVFLGIGAYVALHFFTSEEARIRRRFAQVASLINEDDGRDEKPIARLGLARSLQAFFADPCSIKTPRGSVSGNYTPREMAGLAMRARQSFSDLTLSFRDLKITIRDGTTADTVFTAVLEGSRRSERFRQIREVEATLEKENREWVFTRIETVEVLKK